MSSTSNNNGRALEYIIVKELIDNFQITIKDSCKYMQLKDESYFNSLDINLKDKYLKAASKITNWLSDNYNITGGFLERLDDNQAKSGKSDVTDIRINNLINLSIKHNHLALKHQRPGALPQQCGFIRKSNEDINYRNKYSAIGKEFLKLANSLNPNATLFSELKSIDCDFISKNLYKPVCDLVAQFINQECGSSESNTKFLFKFIVGNIDFTKIVVSQNITIYDFSKIAIPTKVIATVKNDSYVILNFDNGWNISIRLHTASSRLKTLSLKFDSQLIGEVIKPIILNI